MTWNYEGDFNELSGMLLYCITMKYLVNEGRIDEVDNPKLMATAAKEIGLTNEKIADAMIQAGQQLKDAIELEKAIDDFAEVATLRKKARFVSEQ